MPLTFGNIWYFNVFKTEMNSCYLQSDIRIIINISRVNIIVDPETTEQLSDEIMDSFLSSVAVGANSWLESIR